MAWCGGSKAGKSLRALRLLQKSPATQLVDKPLDVCTMLIKNGLAEVTHRWDERINGKLWRCEKVSITEAGREFLRKMDAK